MSEGLSDASHDRKTLLHDLVILKILLKLMIPVVVISALIYFCTTSSGIFTAKSLFFFCSCILLAGVIANHVFISGKLKKCGFVVSQNVSTEVDAEFSVLKNAFINLAGAGKIYYIENIEKINSTRERTAAKNRLANRKITLLPEREAYSLLKTDAEPIIFNIGAAGILCLYPAFILILQNDDDIPVIATWRDVDISYE